MRMQEAVDEFVAGLDYPMYIVTVGLSGQAEPESRSGCLVGFATQCSLNPPRFLVCISKANHTYKLARRAPVLALHIIGPAQHDLAELFGGETGDDVDKFADCRWRPGPGGVPLLTECPRWLAWCRPWMRVSAVATRIASERRRARCSGMIFSRSRSTTTA